MSDLNYDSSDFQKKSKTLRENLDMLQNQINSQMRGSQAQRSKAITRKLIESVSKCAVKIEQVNDRFKNVKTDTMKYFAEQGSFYRWLVSLCLLSWTVALCLILLIGIGKASKCILLIFCATGTFTLVLSWMFIGLQLALTIGSADFCSNTTDYLARKFPAVQVDVLNSYLNCQYWENKQFSDLRSTCRKGLHTAKIQINSIKEKYPSVNSNEVKEIENTLANLDVAYTGFMAALDCRLFHKEYKIGADGVCKTNIVASVIMLLSCTVVVLLLTVLIILSSHAWRHFSKPDEPVADCNKGNVMYEELMLYLPRKGYASVDEDDPFLPRETDSPIRGNSDDISSVPIQLSGGSTENSIDYNSTPKYSNYRGSNTLPNNSHHKTSVINSTPMDGTMPRSHYRVV
ncbi:DgyrCDS2487 [Dimorphilus gyrociliatus]|nr:DgyrCDS2487 [Dimorphilus gyrociliatus]